MRIRFDSAARNPDTHLYRYIFSVKAGFHPSVGSSYYTLMTDKNGRGLFVQSDGDSAHSPRVAWRHICSVGGRPDLITSYFNAHPLLRPSQFAIPAETSPVAAMQMVKAALETTLGWTNIEFDDRELRCIDYTKDLTTMKPANSSSPHGLS